VFLQFLGDKEIARIPSIDNLAIFLCKCIVLTYKEHSDIARAIIFLSVAIWIDTICDSIDSIAETKQGKLEEKFRADDKASCT